MSKQNFQRVEPLYICGSCYAGKSRLRLRINQKASVVVNFGGNILTIPAASDGYVLCFKK